MKVKWYRRRGRANSILLCAKLAKSVRKSGKPSDVHIAYLAAIDQKKISSPAHRFRFWRDVHRKLTQVKGITEQDRAKFISSLARRIPEPTAEELGEKHVHVMGMIAEVNTLYRGGANDALRLYEGHGWLALGYSSWEELVEKEFVQKGTFSKEDIEDLLSFATCELPDSTLQ
jgi:hypothetical protein